MDKNYSINSKKAHPLLKVWNAYPQSLSNTAKSITAPASIEEIIGELFSFGEFYYYTINVPESTLMFTNNRILKMHGLKKQPKYLKEIIDLIHPEDIDFVIEAERMTLEKMNEIGWEHQQNLKCSYCFRMKTFKGNYEMFHHQSLHITKDQSGKLLQAVNIHTNIHHITHQNSYTVLVAGIGGRSDFHQMQYRKNNAIDSLPPYLTKREIEILSYLAKGNSAKQISEILDLSYHTVTTHRKNILHKTDCKKIPELVKKGLEWGLI